MAIAPVPPLLTPEEFDARYASSDRALEFWDGEIVEKPVPTWIHSVLQAILTELLRHAGYKGGPELNLRIGREFWPRPDIAVGRQSVPTRHPTSPKQVEVVVEVLSPDDKFVEVQRKCRRYARLGIEQIYVMDPEDEVAWLWDRDAQQLNVIHFLHLTNGAAINLADVWAELRRTR